MRGYGRGAVPDSALAEVVSERVEDRVGLTGLASNTIADVRRRSAADTWVSEAMRSVAPQLAEDVAAYLRSDPLGSRRAFGPHIADPARCVLTPKNVIWQMAAALSGEVFTNDPTWARLSAEAETMPGIDEAIRSQDEIYRAFALVIAEVSVGLRPVLFISAVQQQALSLSDATETPSFADEVPPLIVFSEPVTQGSFSLLAVIPSQSGDAAGIAHHVEESDDASIGGLYIAGPFGPDVWPILSTVGLAIEAFGTRDVLTTESRAERRRRARTAGWSPKMAIRELATSTDTMRVRRSDHLGGRSLAPHLRRGHFRRVWCGPTHGDRHTELRYIAPVIVNESLGTPRRPVGYVPSRAPASDQEAQP